MALRERTVELAGYGSRALETGSAGPTLLFLHGFADSADTWRLLLAELARRGRRAVALDLPGFGQATRVDHDQAILPQLDRFAWAAIRDAAGPDGTEVIVVGHSLGACVALRAAQRDNLPIAGIVAVAPAGLEMARWLPIIEGERLVRMLLRAPFPLPELVVRDLVGRVYRSLAFAHPGAVDPAVVAAFTRHIRSQDDMARILATGRRLRPELRDPFQLDRIACPVLMVWGEADRMVLTTGAERVLREVPESRIEVIEHCGHCPQIEATERLVGLLERFPLAERRATRGSRRSSRLPRRSSPPGAATAARAPR